MFYEFKHNLFLKIREKIYNFVYLFTRVGFCVKAQVARFSITQQRASPEPSPLIANFFLLNSKHLEFFVTFRQPLNYYKGTKNEFEFLRHLFFFYEFL